MKFRLEHAVLVGGLVAVVLGVLLFGRAPATPEQVDEQRAGETRSYSKRGTSALYTALSRLGATAGRWEKRFDLLRDDVDLLVVATPGEEPDADEVRGLLEWVARGGSVLVFPDRRSATFTAALGWKLDARTRGSTTLTARIDGESYRLGVATDSRVQKAEDAVAVVEDEMGWLISRRRHGRGTIVVVADGAMATNEGIEKAENAEAVVRGLVWPLADGGRIVFDEYHHGHDSEQGLYGYVMSTPAGSVVWHAIVAGFLLMLLGRRLGPAREVHEEQRRRPVEFIEAFARICRARGARGLAASLVAAEAREALKRRFGAADRDVIVREAAKRGKDGPRLAAALEKSSVSAGRTMSAAELMRLTAALDELRAMAR